MASLGAFLPAVFNTAEGRRGEGGERSQTTTTNAVVPEVLLYLLAIGLLLFLLPILLGSLLSIVTSTL